MKRRLLFKYKWVNRMRDTFQCRTVSMRVPFLHLNVPLKHVKLNSTPSWGQYVLKQTHMQTHWGGAGDHRTDTAGRWLLELARQHEHTPLTRGSRVGLWSEINDPWVVTVWGQRLVYDYWLWICFCCWVHAVCLQTFLNNNCSTLCILVVVQQGLF